MIQRVLDAVHTPDSRGGFSLSSPRVCSAASSRGRSRVSGRRRVWWVVWRGSWWLFFLSLCRSASLCMHGHGWLLLLWGLSSVAAAAAVRQVGWWRGGCVGEGRERGGFARLLLLLLVLVFMALGQEGGGEFSSSFSSACHPPPTFLPPAALLPHRDRVVVSVSPCTALPLVPRWLSFFFFLSALPLGLS